MLTMPVVLSSRAGDERLRVFSLDGVFSLSGCSSVVGSPLCISTLQLSSPGLEVGKIIRPLFGSRLTGVNIDTGKMSWPVPAKLSQSWGLAQATCATSGRGG